MEDEKIVPNSFCESNLTLTPKPNKDITRKGNYQLISLMNINGKILNKILANEIQQCINTYNQEGFISGI